MAIPKQQPEHDPASARDVAPEVDHLRSLLDDSSDLAAIMSTTGDVHYLNRAGRRMLGIAPDAALGDVDIESFVDRADMAALQTELTATLVEDGAWAGSITLRTPHGSEIITRSTFRLHHSATSRNLITWVARDISTDRAVVEHIANRAFYDAVTGLHHKSLFLDRLDLSLRKLRDDAGPVAVLFVSLDRFREKNDRFGHEIGDELLRGVARRLIAIIGDRDTVTRWGGDEFVVLREGISSDADAIEFARRLQGAFEDPFQILNERIFMTLSIGAVTAAPGELTIDDVLRRADAACQIAKQRGGDALHVFDAEMRARALRRAEIEDALRGAAERDELVLYFQPEVRLRTGDIVAVEALLRWHHPDWGLVSPAEFIPIAEQSAVIFEIGDWVLRTSMEQAARWRARFPDRELTVAMNISPRQFVQDDFVETIARGLAASGAEPHDICLEITEGILMSDVDLTVTTLKRLKALGVRLAVDDFGTGYSSLSYLRRFPVDVLKVDQSFVRGLGHDPEDSAIVQAVVSMGQALGLTTVAEGVETGHHVIELRELACDIAQGYHFARPVPAETISHLLEAGRDWMTIAS